jgi:hypothetical protein
MKPSTVVESTLLGAATIALTSFLFGCVQPERSNTTVVPLESVSTSPSATPPCATISLNSTRFQHTLNSYCSSEALVTVRWKGRLRDETSAYRVMGNSSSEPWSRRINILDHSATPVVTNVQAIDARCLANHCPKADSTRVRLTSKSVGGQLVYLLRNTTGSYAYMRLEVVEYPETPREQRNEVWLVADQGDTRIYSFPDPATVKVLIAEAEVP